MPDKEIKIYRNFDKCSGLLEEEYEYYDGVDAKGNPIHIRHGYYKEWFETATWPVKEYNYCDGKLHGYQLTRQWEGTNEIASEGHFDNGVPVGTHYTYGMRTVNNVKVQIKTTGTYVNGMIDGPVKTTLDDGTVVEHVEYCDGYVTYIKSLDHHTGYKTILEELTIDEDYGTFIEKYEGNVACKIQFNTKTNKTVLFEDYDGGNDKRWLALRYEADNDGKTIRCTQYYPSGNIHSRYIPTSADYLRSDTVSLKADTNTTEPGPSTFFMKTWIDDDIYRKNVAQIVYYEDGSIKQACFKHKDHGFDGEFIYYGEDGEIFEHCYFHNKQDVMEELLETVDKDQFQDITEDDEVTLTLQYGPLMRIPEKYLR